MSIASRPAADAPGQIDRRTFLLGAVAELLDPPLPCRRRMRIAIMGDSVAQDLWFGLEQVMPNSARCAFIQHGRPSTGLTQASFFDWPAYARQLSGEEEWGAALILMGLNDNMPIKLEKGWVQAGEPAWRTAYGQRAAEVMRPFLDRQVPVAWIGPPCVRAKSMDRNMHVIHDVLAACVPEAGGIFVSSREMTSGPDHEYMETAQNDSGRLVRLRLGDGVHFTGEGNRYLAARVLEALRANPVTAPIFTA